jgi:hypothetical protein
MRGNDMVHIVAIVDIKCFAGSSGLGHVISSSSIW